MAKERGDGYTFLAARGLIRDRIGDGDATSAVGVTGEGDEIQASFCATKPPGVSHLSVCCLSGKKSFHYEPKVVFSRNDLILFAIAFGSQSSYFSPQGIHLFVYQAKNKNLFRLPDHKNNCSLGPTNTGLVCQDGGYVVAALNIEPTSGRYALSIFDSKSEDKCWKKKYVPGHVRDFPPFRHTKVISLTESSLGWVDLWRGILICDVFSEEPIQYINFPDPTPCNKEFQFECDAALFRDVCCGATDGIIKFIEMEYIETGTTVTSDSDFEFEAEEWNAITWTRPWRLIGENWRKGKTFGIGDIQVGEVCTRQAFLDMPIGNPTLSPCDDLLYLISKKSYYDHTGSVLSIDTVNYVLRGRTEFSVGDAFGFTASYRPCSFLQYLHISGQAVNEYKPEGKLKKPLSDMESWKLARAWSNLKDGESEYYGNTEKNLESYKESFTRLHPGPDAGDPILSQTDETAVVAIEPRYHGRYPCLDGVITPSVSYTRLRATNPSPSGSTGRSQPSLASQHAAYEAFVELKHVEYLQRVQANEDYNRRMMEAELLSVWSSMQNRMDPPSMGPAPPPSLEPPYVPTFDEWVALGSGTPGTCGSSVGGSTPASESPVTPVWLGGAGLGSAGGDDPSLR